MAEPQTQTDIWHELLYPGGQPGWWVGPEYAEPAKPSEPTDGFVIGDRVTKVGGDYQFYGFVQAVFRKKSGKLRYVVENRDGLLHIFNGNQLVADAYDR